MAKFKVAKSARQAVKAPSAFTRVEAAKLGKTAAQDLIQELLDMVGGVFMKMDDACDAFTIPQAADFVLEIFNGAGIKFTAAQATSFTLMALESAGFMQIAASGYSAWQQPRERGARAQAGEAAPPAKPPAAKPGAGKPGSRPIPPPRCR